MIVEAWAHTLDVSCLFLVFGHTLVWLVGRITQADRQCDHEEHAGVYAACPI